MQPTTASLAAVFNQLALLLLRPTADGATEALLDVAQALGLSAPEAAEDLEDSALGREYTLLFQGQGSDLLCESDWTIPLRLPCQDAKFECRRAYAACGIAPQTSNTPDDHLGLMMAFLALTLQQGQTEAAKVFAEAHPARWAPAFAAQMLRREEARLYKTVGAALLSALDALKRL